MTHRALLYCKSGLRPHTALIVLVAALLVVTGIREIAEDNYEQLLLIVQCTIAAALFAFGAAAAFRGLRAAQQRNHEEHEKQTGQQA